MKRDRLILVYLFIIISFVGSVAFADEISFSAHVDSDSVEINSALALSLVFTGAQDIPAPELGEIDGFRWKYLGPSTRISIVNGRKSSSITHNYTLIPLKTGKLQIPQISVKYRGKTYKSDMINIEVLSSAPDYRDEDKTGPLKGRGSQQSLEDNIFLVIDTPTKQAYIGEKIPISVYLFINKISVRDIGYPKFLHDGFSADSFQKPSQYSRTIDGINYDVVEFKTHIYGIAPGRFQLGPAEITCNVMVKSPPSRGGSSFLGSSIFGSDIFEDFFGNYESHPVKIKSMDLALDIMPLPEEEKPSDFKAAIGNYELYVDATPCEIKTGDPITLVVKIKGEGNFNTVEMPALTDSENFRLYTPEVQQTASEKIFEQIVIPLKDTIREIPSLSFSFFDPRYKSYSTITSDPIPINIIPLPEGREFKIMSFEDILERQRLSQQELLGIDMVYIKEGSGNLVKIKPPFCKTNLFLMLLYLPPFIMFGVTVFLRRRKRFASDIRYARKQGALKTARKNIKQLQGLKRKGAKKDFFDQAFRTIKLYLGDKFYLPAAGITSDIVYELKNKGIDASLINDLGKFFSLCDMARYAPSETRKDDIEAAFDLVKSILDKTEKAKI
jgi:hypothetical protein